MGGYSDKRIARRLGISERSLQGHIAAMKQELGAHTRVQLGYLLARNETTFVP
ncbi:LuxR C-terminal-related transcriptional regulator [Streptomyces violens]|uniref:LuxR C-terminal-related transcriptional regulator n=1 Tax=Streptomyces violens TaxID=66377 RepID=UPI003CCBCCAC